MSRFKINQDLLKRQQREFTKGGVVLRNVFSISTRHPWLSLIFVLAFGLLTNALFELVSYATTTTENFDGRILLVLALWVAVFTLLPCLVYLRIRALHKDLLVDTPLSQKKLLVSLVSKGRSDFKETPTYNTYEALLYNTNGHATANALEKVVLVVSESPETLTAANGLKAHIEAGGRTAEIYGITIENKSLLEIQAQVETLFSKFTPTYAPHEIVADYTGGTKDMSIALLKVSEKELVLPIYLNDATAGNHSKYN